MKFIPISIYHKKKNLIPNALYAESFLSRIKGLMGSQKLSADKGLLIPNCRQVHTFFMNYTIDIIFLDKKNKVIDIQTLSPWKVSRWMRKAQKVLEVPKGFAKKKGLKNGDVLEVKQK